jgi:hypothetical protein
MASSFTIVLSDRQHFGDDQGTFDDIEPGVPFVGRAKDFRFDCPNVDSGETAVLMFQSRDVDHSRNILQINGVDVGGGLPVSPARDAWNGNVLLVEPRRLLREVRNVLHVEARSRSGGSIDVDDFIIDNVVIEYKTRARTVSLADFAPSNTDDWTVAMSEAIAHLKARGGGGTLLVPQRRYRLSDKIVVSQMRGLVIQGQGAIATDFEWAGDVDRPMFEFNRTQGCYLEHVSITARRTHPLLEGVRIQQSREPDTSDPNWPNLSSSLMTIRDTIFNGQGAMGTAIRVHCVDPTPGHDIKNDFHRFERLQISGCLHAGLVLEGRNAKQLSLRDVVIQGRIGPEDATVLNYGVLTVANASPTKMEKTNGEVTLGPLGDPAINDGRPVYNHGAAFSWISGACMATRIANVYIGDRNDTLLLKAIYCEKGSRWLVVPDYDNGAAGAFPIELDSLRYTVNENTPADGEIIQVHSDSLMITNCDFGARTAGEQIRIRFHPLHGPGAFVLQGNTITNAGDHNVFVAQPPDNPDYPVTNLGYDGTALVKLGPAKAG